MRLAYLLVAVMAGVWAACHTPQQEPVTRPEGPPPPQLPVSEQEDAGGGPVAEPQPPRGGAPDAADTTSAVVDAEPPKADVAEGPSVADVCEALCVQLDKRCEARAARRCRGRCPGYVDEAVGCEAEYRAALECQAGAEKTELCGEVVATQCLDLFRAIKRCERGEVATVAQRKLPDGWESVADDQLGISVGLPAGAALDPDAKRRTWRAQEGAVEYVVAQLPPPGKPVTQAMLLRMVVQFVGFRCQKNLKLHGQFETGDETALRFDTGCHDGTEWHGMLRVRPNQAVATAFHAAAGSEGVIDEFVYSYERSDTEK